MPFIYHISDVGKSIKFKGKLYHTPCSIHVKTVPEIKMLRSALSKKGIKKVKAERSTHQKRMSKKVPLNVGDGSVKLNSFIKN